MKKLLYIAPHLSTGGLPQYLVKKIELLKGEFEIYVVEYSNHTGGVLVVQRDKILNLVESNKFFELGEDKTELIHVINQIQPDIIHLEEIPEYFMDFDLAKEIYRTDRPYYIVETSHDSSYDTSQKSFYPDKFLFVSEWQVQQYKDIDIPKKVVYYPIEYKERPDRTEALEHLGLNPNKKHILHIGLFTPRKNQSEFFEYARMLPEYEFHCVGNQAGNFKHYWEPLMNDKPDNVTWWNERTDVDNFYRSMDLFLFTSRGSNNDKETMPLVIRESLSWNMNLLIYNLPVYLDYFNQFDNVNYLNFSSKEENIKLIKSSLEGSNEIIDPSEEAYVVCTYPVSDAIVQTTKECINSLKRDGRKIIISAHAPVPQELQEMVDYVFYDSNNILTKHTFYSSFNFYTDLYDTNINLRGEGNDVYHGPACYTSFRNPATFAQNLGIKKLHFINYDYILKDENYINYISKILNTKDTFFGEFEAQEGKCYYTYFFSSKPEAILQQTPDLHSAKEYDDLMVTIGSESNGIENMYYNLFKNYPNNYIEPKEKFEADAEKYFNFEDYSMVEYYTILPTNVPGRFCPWITISNSKESKLIHYTVETNGELIIDRNLEVTGKYYFWDMVSYSLGDTTKVTFYITDLNTGKFIKEHSFNLNKDYFLNKMPNNGSFTWKGDTQSYNKKPKIKLLHLVTEPDTNKKEIRSVENIKEFCNSTDIEYKQCVNKIWKTTPPKENCHRPDSVQDKPGYYKLAPGHYGCFLAHKNAILEENNEEYDYILIFEGDVIIDTPFNELYNKLIEFDQTAIKTDMDIIGFGNPTESRNLNGPKIDEIHTDVVPFVPAQSYLITKTKLAGIKEKLITLPWDAFDLWVCNVAKLRVGTADKIYTKHLPGFSIIEQEFKGMDENSPEIYAKQL